MPTYLYNNCIFCDHDPTGEHERMVPIDDRNNQYCYVCGERVTRKVAFTGLTWSPTRNGGHS